MSKLISIILLMLLTVIIYEYNRTFLYPILEPLFIFSFNQINMLLGAFTIK
jgi:hypothetical protein